MSEIEFSDRVDTKNAQVYSITPSGVRVKRAGHPVIRPVILSRSSGHPVIQKAASVGHPVIRSSKKLPQSVIRSSGHPLSRSSGHPVIQTRSSGHPKPVTSEAGTVTKTELEHSKIVEN